MTNLEQTTRKEQILRYLRANKNEWVDGSALATAEVGGSEGLRRLRELRTEAGITIQQRRHPDPARDIWQYRLIENPSGVTPLRGNVVPPSRGPEPRLIFGINRFCDRCDGKGRQHGQECQICGGRGWL